MRALVTGGAGFIGSHLVRALLSQGDAVVVLDDLSTGREENLAGLSGDLELVRGDICDEGAVARALRGVEAVLHHAAVASVTASVQDPLRCDQVNVAGTLRLLLAAREAGTRRFVLAASSAAYGDEPTQPKRESMPPQALSPYAAAKVAGEQYVRTFAALYGMQAVALRYFNIFGPRQDPASDYAAVIPKFISLMMKGKRPRIFGDGEQTRDFLYVEDVVRANLLALRAERAAGQVLNIATGRPITVNELVDELNTVLGTDLDPIHDAERPGDIKHSSADVSRARELLGFEARTPLAEGLRRTAEHFA